MNNDDGSEWPKGCGDPTHNHGRWCFYTSSECLIKGVGYQVALVYECEDGPEPIPVVLGPTLEAARYACSKANAELGLSPEEVELIIARSKQIVIRRQHGVN